MRELLHVEPSITLADILELSILVDLPTEATADHQIDTVLTAALEHRESGPHAMTITFTALGERTYPRATSTQMEELMIEQLSQALADEGLDFAEKAHDPTSLAPYIHTQMRRMIGHRKVESTSPVSKEAQDEVDRQMETE